MKIIMKINKISFTPTHLYTNTEKKEIFVPDLLMKGFSGMLRQDSNRDKRMVMYLDIPIHINELGFKDLKNQEIESDEVNFEGQNISRNTIKLVNANDIKGLNPN